jgi:hypothetical protein
MSIDRIASFKNQKERYQSSFKNRLSDGEKI